MKAPGAKTPGFYPPRANRLLTGDRARAFNQAGHSATRALRILKWAGIAFVPGLPFARTKHRVAAWTCGAAYLLFLGAFLRSIAGSEPKWVSLWLPGVGRATFQPAYLWYGLAAAVHIVSVLYLLRPLSAGFSREVQIGISLGVAVVMYSGFYGLLLDAYLS